MLKCSRYISDISTKYHDLKQTNVLVLISEGSNHTNVTVENSENLISLERIAICFSC
jgi:hypothetical protein